MRGQSARIGRHFRFCWPANQILPGGSTDPILPGPIYFVCWPRFQKPAPLWVKKVWSSLAIPVLTDIRVSFCSPGGPDPVPLTSGARNCRIIVVPWPSRPTGGLHTLQCHETDGRPTIAAAAALPRVAFH